MINTTLILTFSNKININVTNLYHFIILYLHPIVNYKLNICKEKKNNFNIIIFYLLYH